MNTSPTYTLQIFETLHDLSKAAAEFMIALAKDTVKKSGRFSVAFSGGSTPRQLYTLLAQEPYSTQMPWQNTHVFWGDERCVPLMDESNNAQEAKLILLDRVSIPPSHIHRVPVNLVPEEAATSYEKELDVFFAGEEKRFDLVLLGLGENGHTASLFPGTDVLTHSAKGVRSVFVEEQNMFRITLTAPLINSARNILFMVSGNSKSEILNEVLNNTTNQHKYPAHLIHPVDGKLYWFADKAAAKKLSR